MAGMPIRQRGAPLGSQRRWGDAIAAILEVFLYIAWLGSLVGIAFVAAPAAFAHAPAQQAGAIVGASLRATTWFAWVCGGVLLLIWLFRIPREGRTALAGALLIAVAIGATDYARWSIAPKMDAIVAQVDGAISALPAGDARRATFDALHRRSTQTYGVVLVCGFLAAALTAARRR
ncbi:MAG TPA: DUF4149 domain-containing protein [Candidatus Dormibacteraeota bacterium]|nr:DUF4149 domain-containing protein [Candidatus Dormibacteraeota bacterium]